IVAEVAGTISLRAAVDHRAWIALVVAAYIAAFTLIGLTLRAGMPIGVAYGIWGATGVALVAILGAVIFGERLSVDAVAGIVVITVGVALVESGAHADRADTDEGAGT